MYLSPYHILFWNEKLKVHVIIKKANSLKNNNEKKTGKSVFF